MQAFPVQQDMRARSVPSETIKKLSLKLLILKFLCVHLHQCSSQTLQNIFPGNSNSSAPFGAALMTIL